MWNANITGQNVTKGILQVTVEFTNGSSTFPIIYDVSGLTIEDLQKRISDQIGVLNANDLLLSKLVIGPFIPLVQVDNKNFQSAIRNLQIAKQNVDLGIINSSDASYANALTEAKNAYAGSGNIAII